MQPTSGTANGDQIFSEEIDTASTTCELAQELTDYFKQLIDEHKAFRFIAAFDHYRHTVGDEVDRLDVLITASSGDGFLRKMARRGSG